MLAEGGRAGHPFEAVAADHHRGDAARARQTAGIACGSPGMGCTPAARRCRWCSITSSRSNCLTEQDLAWRDLPADKPGTVEVELDLRAGQVVDVMGWTLPHRDAVRNKIKDQPGEVVDGAEPGDRTPGGRRPARYLAARELPAAVRGPAAEDARGSGGRAGPAALRRSPAPSERPTSGSATR